MVAVFLLLVIGAMMALSIDVVTLYTARSEAQLAADAAALAGARTLANSGMTSDPNAVTDGLASSAEMLASNVALQVGQSNLVGGRNLVAANGEVVVVGFGGTATNPCVAPTNPCITVRVQRTDLPTFFARIWGRKQLAVAASATAEAYNPSGASASGGTTIPVAPMCVKPWLLPNISPNNSTLPIFNPGTGAIGDPSLLGWPYGPTPPLRMTTDCAPCTNTSAPSVWKYYPGTTDPSGDFPAPSASSCIGCGGFNSYQLSVAGCVQTPISCNKTVHIDQANDVSDPSTALAVNVLAHSNSNGGDVIDYAAAPPPFQFVAGADNPLVLSNPSLSGTDIMVSDSLVTVPVINVDNANWPPSGYGNFPNVQIIGFVQLFVSTTGRRSVSGRLRTQVINLAGCGTNASGQPIIGNGASPVPVRLISPP